MQKLVSIALCYDAVQHRHGTVLEHLRDDLRNGWKIRSLHGITGATQRYGLAASRDAAPPLNSLLTGWVFVLLEKKPAAPSASKRTK